MTIPLYLQILLVFHVHLVGFRNLIDIIRGIVSWIFYNLSLLTF